MNVNLNTRSLIPIWRWCLYVILLAVVIGLFGLIDHWLLLLIPCGIAATVLILLGIIWIAKNLTTSQWVRRNLKWLILAYAFGQTVLLIWKWLDK